MSDFKSKLDWPKFPSNLPTRDGVAQGKSFENRTIANTGGAEQIRKKIIDNPDGTQTIYDARAGFPTFRTSGKKPVAATLDRTFVFNVFGLTAGVIANRSGAGMLVRVASFVADISTYCVGALKSEIITLWRDVFRATGVKLYLNGNSPTPLNQAIPNHGRLGLPFVAQDGTYHETCSGDGTRSTLFIGKATEAVTPIVQSISTTGTIKSSLVGTGISNAASSAAGIRLANDTYKIYGLNMAQTNDVVFYLYPTWSNIKAQRASPYLSESSHGTVSRVDLRDYPYLPRFNAVNHNPVLNNHTSAGFSIGVTLCPFYISPSILNRVAYGPSNYTMNWDEHYDILYNLSPSDYISSYGEYAIQRTASYVYTVDNSVPAFGYAGSDIELSLLATLDVAYNSHRKNAVKYYPYSSGGNAFQFSGGSVLDAAADANIVTTFKMTSALTALGYFTDVVCTFTGSYVNYFDYVPTVASIPYQGTTINYNVSFFSLAAQNAAIANQDTPGYNKIRANTVLTTPTGTLTATRSRVMTAKTRDHLYADIEESVFITLESTLTLTRNETYNFGTATWAATDVYNLKLKYVLDVRGALTEFSVYDDDTFTAPIIDIGSVSSGDTNVDPIENWHTEYHPGYKPPPIFAPPFMAQGNCPYVAYTTKAEEAGTPPATPEIYVDFPVKIMRYSTFTGSRYDGVVPFVPHQFLAMFRRYIGGEDKLEYPTYALTQNTTFWDTLFPTGAPFRIQFCNGVKGVWAGQLGAGFGGDPAMEITRI